MIKDYYISDTLKFYSNYVHQRLKFLKKRKFLFNEISFFLSNLVNKSKKLAFFGCGNLLITKKILSDKIYVNEVNDFIFDEFKNQNYEKIENLSEFENQVSEFDHIVFADIEHQKNISTNLLNIGKIINDDCRVIVISKSLIWHTFINWYKRLSKKSGPLRNNYLPFSNLKQIFINSNLDVLRNEKIIIMPFHIPYISKIINLIFRLPILNFFCLLNITVLKKKIVKNSNEQKISVIIPCKNEEDNIKLFKEEIPKLNLKVEFLFGDDKSEDDTLNKLNRLKEELSDHDIKIYNGPGICKSDNVYTGIEYSTGDIIAIYDADLTVSFNDMKKSIDYLKQTNSDFINCSRMVIPQRTNAMKNSNYFGNIFFAFMFSILFKNKITDTLCGTKIFYKKDWLNIKNYSNELGIKDLWGDFDLLIGAYKNNLKISEVPVFYLERKEEETKMTNVIKNALRMLMIVINSYYRLRIKN